MKILVTGGAGFIGSAVIRHIIRTTDDTVVNVDKLTYAANLAALEEAASDPRYAFEQVDICDHAEMSRVLRQHQPDVVMHLAAESHVDRSISGPASFIQTNIVGTYTLLEAVRTYWASLDETKQSAFRFLHVSTDEVYGDLPHPDDAPAGTELPKFTEESNYNPSSPYSASKAASDHLVKAWHRTYGIPVLISHCSNNYGPYQHPEKLIPMVIKNALEGKPIPVYGKGNQIRDWLYVEDHATALYRLVEKGTVGETYNIGGRNEVKNLELVNIICNQLDQLVPKKTSYKNQIVHVTDRPGHDLRYSINTEKIVSELKWLPRQDFVSLVYKTTAECVGDITDSN